MTAQSHTAGLTLMQAALLLEIDQCGAIHSLLFSEHRGAGPSLREVGLIDGFGQDVHLTKLGRAAIAKATGEAGQ